MKWKIVAWKPNKYQLYLTLQQHLPHVQANAYANNGTMLSTDNVCHPNHRRPDGAKLTVRVNSSDECFRWMPKTVFSNFLKFHTLKRQQQQRPRQQLNDRLARHYCHTLHSHLKWHWKATYHAAKALLATHFVLHATCFVPTWHIDTRRISSMRDMCCTNGDGDGDKAPPK